MTLDVVVYSIVSICIGLRYKVIVSFPSTNRVLLGIFYSGKTTYIYNQSLKDNSPKLPEMTI